MGKETPQGLSLGGKAPLAKPLRAGERTVGWELNPRRTVCTKLHTAISPVLDKVPSYHSNQPESAMQPRLASNWIFVCLRLLRVRINGIHRFSDLPHSRDFRSPTLSFCSGTKSFEPDHKARLASMVPSFRGSTILARAWPPICSWSLSP